MENARNHVLGEKRKSNIRNKAEKQFYKNTRNHL